MEWEGPSIDCAKASAKHLKKNYRFIAGKIDEEFVQTRLPRPVLNEPEKILLDPPRKGCEPGVIHALAMRKTIRVAHVFCGTDEIPASLKEWDVTATACVKCSPWICSPERRTWKPS